VKELCQYYHHPDYPHPDCDKKTQFKRGTSDQLQQRTGVGFDNSHKSSVVELFDWSSEEESRLGSHSLGKGQGGTLIDTSSNTAAACLRASMPWLSCRKTASPRTQL
jgi:hypothetical protein